MAIGGDILEVRVNHPTLGARTLYPKAAEDNTYDPGGFRNEDDENMIDGSGEMIIKKNRKRGFLEVVLANDQNTREDADFCVALCESPELADVSFANANGTVYGGLGTIVGDVQPNLNAATFSVKFAFQGKVNKIAG